MKWIDSQCQLLKNFDILEIKKDNQFYSIPNSKNMTLQFNIRTDFLFAIDNIVLQKHI